MADGTNHEMALDILRCHLGMSKEEALEELGISDAESVEQQVLNAQSQLARDTK
ncbi:hypothetical protein AB4343_02940 [Vibrio breoganii]|uniref:Uncharacterized protein n=1 Tax=Vibrio breoganii TaxID=553239 RepID=A0ABX1U6Q6_9VIBR|nr:hypothetical protein [Vibrio breoganii]MDN3715683.1 hypothetical protein [Vibrio breoganii]NMO73710.1 hypothetical protein [Vibrio breoganii]NMR70148.1 hypothetical protein [Vibrio breoganii]